MVAPAVEEVFGDVAYELREVRFENILYLEEGRQPTVRVTMGSMEGGDGGEGSREVTIESLREGDGGWTMHARMRLVVVEGWEERVEVDEIKGRCGEATECGEDFYGTLGN
eukprot:365536-Rhodomonas_salina.1